MAKNIYGGGLRTWDELGPDYFLRIFSIIYVTSFFEFLFLFEARISFFELGMRSVYLKNRHIIIKEREPVFGLGKDNILCVWEIIVPKSG